MTAPAKDQARTHESSAQDVVAQRGDTVDPENTAVATPDEISPPDRPGPGPAREWTLLVVCLALFMLVLDMTVVAVALADIQHDLGGDLASLQWVIDAYTLPLAGLLLTAATFGDRRGRRTVFGAGLVVFTVASVGCAVAWSPSSLDVIRAVQGVGGALMFGTAMPLVGAAFPSGAGRARAIGAAGASVTAATALGPLVGGALVDLDSWRWIFFINVPVGLLLMLLIPKVTQSRAALPRAADWSGSLLLTACLLASLLALIRGNSDGWGSRRVLALLGAAVLLLAGFVMRELAAREPMLDLQLFALPRFAGLSIASFASSATLIASSTYLTLYLANVMGYTPLDTGLRMLPLTLPALVAAPLAAVLMRWLSLWSLVFAAVTLSGSGLLLASAVTTTSAWTVFVPGFVIGGLGLGMIGAVLPGGALTTVEPDRFGMATGAVNTLRHVGIAAGVAALGAVFQRVATDRSSTLLASTPFPEDARERLADGVGAGGGVRIAEGVPEPLRAVAAAVGREASADSLSRVLLIAGIVAVVSAVLSAPLIAVRTSPSPQTEAEKAVEPAPETPAPGDALAAARPTPRPVKAAAAPVGDVIARPSSTREEELSEMTRVNEMQDILRSIRSSLPDLRGVMIASTDGLPIAHDFPVEEAERIAAMAAMAIGIGKRITDRTNLGSPRETLVHGDRGYLAVYAAGQSGVLVLASSVETNLGLLRLEARTASRAVDAALR